MKHRIGIVQMNSSADLRENMRFARQQIEQGSREDLDLIAFPETFLYVGNDHQEKHRVAQTLEGDVVQTFREYARKVCCWGASMKKSPPTIGICITPRC